MDLLRLIRTELIAVFGAPALISGDKGTLRQTAHTVTVPKCSDEIDPLLAAVRPDGACEEIIDAGEV